MLRSPNQAAPDRHALDFGFNLPQTEQQVNYVVRPVEAKHMKRHRCWILLASVALAGCGVDDASPSRTAPFNAIGPKEEETAMVSKWPFKDAENVAVITLTQIVNGSKPILYVVHDDEGDWQFLDGGDVSEKDAATVSLKQVADLDPSIKTLANLPLGWAAERDSVDKPWERFQR